uniref:Uncharacterized protein n=1 Tax=Rhizophora mucronata TaxID=61149 RepID=A0A2P2PCL2_RHIMU
MNIFTAFRSIIQRE